MRLGPSFITNARSQCFFFLFSFQFPRKTKSRILCCSKIVSALSHCIGIFVQFAEKEEEYVLTHSFIVFFFFSFFSPFWSEFSLPSRQSHSRRRNARTTIFFPLSGRRKNSRQASRGFPFALFTLPQLTPASLQYLQ